MKHVRIWFKKIGTARYISHLDLNRCISRAVHKAKIPIWYTKGFNPHAFLTFALPLSLGISGERESMDIKLENDIPKQELMERLNNGLPNDIQIFDVTDPVMKPGQIAFAKYQYLFDISEQSAQEVADQIRTLLNSEQVIVQKHTKNGIRDLDIKPFFEKMELKATVHSIDSEIILPAGSTENINPLLLCEAIKNYLNLNLYVQIRRINLYDSNYKLFE